MGKLWDADRDSVESRRLQEGTSCSCISVKCVVSEELSESFRDRRFRRREVVRDEEVDERVRLQRNYCRESAIDRCPKVCETFV